MDREKRAAYPDEVVFRRGRVIMNRAELKAAMFIMQTGELEAVCSISKADIPDENVLDEMRKKHFLVEEKEGYEWNEFVLFALWSVFHSEYQLLQTTPYGNCNCYFHHDTIILLHSDQAEDRYIFYWMPFIPDAIGGIAAYFEAFQETEPVDGSPEPLFLGEGMELRWPLGADMESALQERCGQTGETAIQLVSMLKTMSKQQATQEMLFLQWDKRIYRVTNQAGKTMAERMDYFEMIKEMAQQAISSHGQAISAQKEG